MPATERTCLRCGRALPSTATRCPNCGRRQEPPAPTGPRRSRKRAFRLLALGGCGLAALFGGALLAALVVPDFLDSIQKAKQTRTMSDLQEWAAALEDYRAGHGGAVPRAEDAEALAELLAGDGARALATTDSWGTPLRYACWSEDLDVDGCDNYRLVSAGRDGAFEEDDPAAYEPGVADPLDYDADLVLGDGQFHRYPAPPG